MIAKVVGGGGGGGAGRFRSRSGEPRGNFGTETTVVYM